MDSKIFTKFNVYDQIGYLMVGGIALITISLNAVLFFKFILPPFSVDTFLVWLIVAYFLGHFLQGVTNIINKVPILCFLVKENKTDFSDDDNEILNKAKTFFGLKGQDNNKLWNLCYMLSCAKDVTGQIQSFNAYYSMSRGWFVIFLLESLFLLYIFISTRNLQVLYFLGLSILFVCVFYMRSKRFWQYVRNKVLQTFMVVQALKL